VKNILKKEITKADTEINRDQTIIKEYKQVSSYKINLDNIKRLEADRSIDIIDKCYLFFFCAYIIIFFIY